MSSVQVNLATERASITALSTVELATLKAAVRKAGYAAKTIEQAAQVGRASLA